MHDSYPRKWTVPDNIKPNRRSRRSTFTAVALLTTVFLLLQFRLCFAPASGRSSLPDLSSWLPSRLGQSAVAESLDAMYGLLNHTSTPAPETDSPALLRQSFEHAGQQKPSLPPKDETSPPQDLDSSSQTSASTSAVSSSTSASSTPLPSTSSTTSSSTIPASKSTPTHSAHAIPPSSKDGPCALLSDATLSSLRASVNTSVHSFHLGQPITADAALPASEAICIIVAVPQTPLLRSVLNQPSDAPYADDAYCAAPIPGYGPDTIHLFVNTTGATRTFPALRPLPGQPGLALTVTEETLLYFVETVLDEPGEWTLHGEHEWTNWQWTEEYYVSGDKERFVWADGTTDKFSGYFPWYIFNPTPLAASSMFPDTITISASPASEGSSRDSASSSSSSSLSATLTSALSPRPTCDGALIPALGSWKAATTQPADLVDEWGYAWEGDACSLAHFDARATFSCLAGKTIHVYGDSMMRRLTRTLVSGGTWCHNLTHSCQSEDSLESVLRLLVEPASDDGSGDGEGAIAPAEPELPETFDLRVEAPRALHFGDGSTIYFHFLDSIVVNPPSWMRPLFGADAINTTPSDVNVGIPNVFSIAPGAAARQPPYLPRADLVLLGLGAWDQAQAPMLSDFEERVVQLRDAVLTAYAGVPMALRLSNSFCCRAGEPWRKYSGTRVQAFDDAVRAAFDVREVPLDGHQEGLTGLQALGGRVALVDPSYMNGRPEVLTQYGIPRANHPRASHTRIEAQMLLNAICARDPYTGRVGPRDMTVL